MTLFSTAPVHPEVLAMLGPKVGEYDYVVQATTSHPELCLRCSNRSSEIRRAWPSYPGMHA